MIFKYPYTDMYNLNLDWMLQAIKEVQQVIGDLGDIVSSVNGMTGDVTLTREIITQILGSVVNSVNGQSGDVLITADILREILGGAVTSFNQRDGAVTLTASDVNQTAIDITWTSDPGDVITSLSQADLDEFYASGKRILVFVNNLGTPDRVYFLTVVGSVVTPQPYVPTSSTSGVLSVNGQSGTVNLNGENLPVAADDTTPITTALEYKQDMLTFDNLPTQNSSNPVKSGGVYSAVTDVNNNLGQSISALGLRMSDAEDDISSLSGQIGDLADLDTNTQTNIVAAVNEVNTAVTPVEFTDGNAVDWNASFVDYSVAQPSATVTTVGKIAILNLYCHPLSLSTITNTSPATLKTSLRPKNNIYGTAYVVPVYNGNSKTYAVKAQILTNGTIRFINDGSYREIGSVTNLTDITIVCTYVLA